MTKPEDFLTLEHISAATFYWYKTDYRYDNTVIAECRLMRGEIPYEGFYEAIEYKRKKRNETSFG